MQKEIIEFIKENNLNPFNKNKTQIRTNSDSIFKTKDAKSIYNKTLQTLSINFRFSETSNIWHFFELPCQIEEIKRRQEFFKYNLISNKSDFLSKLNSPKPSWKPSYGIIVVTENEEILTELKNQNIPVQYLISQYDVELLEDYDLVQVIDCENFTHMLEKLPQTIFLDSIDDIYLERFIIQLSAYKELILSLQENPTNDKIKEITDKLVPLLFFLENKKTKIITKEETELELEKINESVFKRMKEMTIKGEELMSMLSKKEFPKEVKEIIKQEIEISNLSENILNIELPLNLDEKALEQLIKNQSANEFSTIAENVKKYSKALKEIPLILQELDANLLLFDFLSGLTVYTSSTNQFPQFANMLLFEDSKSIFIDKAQPVSFLLNEQTKCSMLTGANSGGKTTLLEHIQQLLVISQLGLPTSGSVTLPLFSEIYYFAKNKGSANKGAFETLLTQMSEIKPKNNTIILADEIEAVTEPGIAGKIISATADFFIRQRCYLVIATHLGLEIKDSLPLGARIDGIEAKGLDANNELVVNHNPVLGRLAHSTPELIIEKLFRMNSSDEYIKHVFLSIKK
jgi:DNA mismatch repair protein MutS2